MSFPRAKIQRFNDVLNNVPSPTKYDPKLCDKVKGGCILKGEAKHSAVCDTASASSGKSCQTPVFRTPQVPKKHNCLGVSEKGSHSAFKSISFRSEDMEFLNDEGEGKELKALSVECSNKTETISELEKHIQDLKNELSNQEKSRSALEAYVAELETAKSNLECIKANNDNYEQQINTLQLEIKTLEAKLGDLAKSKEELLGKTQEIEKRNNSLEESNLDYERKLISLEGTIEHLEMERKSKEQAIIELKQKEEMHMMNNKITIECLHGKISTLENEIKELDSNKSKNEATIFGLETEISNLNGNIENLKSEKMAIEIDSEKFKLQLQELEEAYKNQNSKIVELETALESRIQEIEELKKAKESLMREMDYLKSEMEKGIESFEIRQRELIETYESKMEELEGKFESREREFQAEKSSLEAREACLIRSHEEEILRLQNEYESKLLTQMQENTEKINFLQSQMDEKEASFNKANAKHLNSLAESERKFQEAEANFANLVNKMEGEHLESLEQIKENHSKKMKSVESNYSRVIDMKNKEIDLLSEQYKEILEEIKCLLGYLEKKDEEIKELSLNCRNMNSRTKLMIEEIKLLNKENENKAENLAKMTKKYNDEFGKNEQLSCKLGELDAKISHLREDLNKKVEDWRKTSQELKRFKAQNETLSIKKSNLERIVDDLQAKINELRRELDDKKSVYEENVRRIKQELTEAKSRCKQFEIVHGNTSKSLEALKSRLIECEADFENLDKEKTSLAAELEKVTEEKNDFKIRVEKLMETKTDLETTLDEELSNSRALSEKCSHLESLFKEYENRVVELKKQNDNLEREKQNYLEEMRNLVREHELQLIETERATLDQVEVFSQTVTEKLEFFMKFSQEKIRKMSSEINALKTANEEASASLKSKTEEYDNLFTDYEILKTTVDISVKESENLKNKCEENVLRMEELKKSLNEATREKSDVEMKLAEAEKRCCELNEGQKSLRNELNAKVQSLERAEEIQCALKERVSVLEADAEEQREKLRVTTEELESKSKDLEKAVQEKDEETARCHNEKMICVEELKNLTREKNDLAFNLKVAEGKLTSNEKLLKELRSSKAEIEDRNRELKLELDAATGEKLNAMSELLSVGEEVERLRREKLALEEVVERKNYYKDNCLRLDKLNQELQDENVNLKNDFNEMHFLLKEKEIKLEKLTKNCADLENLIGPFREQLERYETERLLIENDRDLLRKQHLEQAAELGHRNHKQKIQHVVNLKNTLLETRKENEKLTLEIKNLKKKIQKLQEELGHDPKRLFIGGKRPSTTPFKGKENSGLMTPSATLAVVSSASQVKQEPMSPGSPLRNRNQ